MSKTKIFPISRNSKLAIILPIIFFLIVLSLLMFLSHSVGFTVYFDYKETIFTENRFYTEEADGAFSHMGVYVFFLSVLFTWRFSRFLTTGNFNGNLTFTESTVFKYLLIW